MVDGNGTETGHIIVTTIGGRNGQPKQVSFIPLFSISAYGTFYRYHAFILLVLLDGLIQKPDFYDMYKITSC